MTFAARFCVSFMFLVALCSRASAELAAVAGLVVGKVNLPGTSTAELRTKTPAKQVV